MISNAQTCTVSFALHGDKCGCKHPILLVDMMKTLVKPRFDRLNVVFPGGGEGDVAARWPDLCCVWGLGRQQGFHVIEQGASQVGQVIGAQEGPQRAQHGLMLGEEVLRGKAKDTLRELLHRRPVERNAKQLFAKLIQL